MKKLLFKFALLFFLVQSYQSQAADKRVFGFIGDWHNNAYFGANGLQYDYLTDVVYSFALPQANGSLGFDIGSTSWYNKLNNLATNAHAKGVKVHFSAGGWGASNGVQGPGDPIHEMANNPTARAAFVANIMNIVKTYNLDGFNMDWEYPANTDGSVLDDLILELKLGLINLESEMGKKLELSVAVGATSHGTGAYSVGTLSLIDFVMIMAFDNNTTHHSTFAFAKSAMSYWVDSKGLRPEQMILAIPFYSRGTNAPERTYAYLSSSDPAAYFNDADGSLNTYEYNSAPLIEQKIDEMQSRGGSGVFCWELPGDRTDQYSLLRVMYGSVVSTEEAPSTLTGVKVFPNPFSTELNFNLTDNNLLSEELTYSIADITGKQVLSGQLTALNNKVDLTSINSKGVYFVSVTNNKKESTTFKVVKK